MFSLARPKPLPPANIDPPPDYNFFYHIDQGEDYGAYLKLGKVLNSFWEIFKFLPNFAQEGYTLGREESTSDAGIGEWTEAMFNDDGDRVRQGFSYRERIDGDYSRRYGDWHSSTYGLEDAWGYGKAKEFKNFDNKPGVTSRVHITDEDLEEYLDGEDLVDPVEYAALLFAANQDDIPENDISLARITNYHEVEAFLAQPVFSGLNFFQIMTKGGDYSTLSSFDSGGDGRIDNRDTVLPGNGFLYEGKEDYGGIDGKGAFLMMEAILSARRDVNWATSLFLGSPSDIKENNNQPMIDQQDWFLNEYLRGADVHNLSLLSLIPALQHSWHTANLLLTGGAVQGNGTLFKGFRYDARTSAASNKFINWLRANVAEYIANLSDGPDKESAIKLKEEAFFEIPDLPYGLDGSNGEGIGWDYFSKTGSSPGGWVAEGINPLAVYDADYRNRQNILSHSNYAISQILGFDTPILMGEQPVMYEGRAYWLQDTNWVFHAVGSIEKYQNQAKLRTLQTLWLNMQNMQNYKNDYRKWKKEVVEKSDAEYNEKLDELLAEKRKGMAKSENAKSAQKAKKVRQKMANYSNNKAKKIDQQTNRLSQNKAAARKSNKDK